MIPDDLHGRTLLVTGASSGIGRALAEALAARGARVILAARSAARTAPVLDAIRERRHGAEASFVALDLADLGSVRRAAEQVLAEHDWLDVLVNNAAVAGTFALSRDGFDLTYATNHLGPFLLTSLLLPALREAPAARIVNVASAAHLRVRRIDWSRLERRATPRFSGFDDYAVTKLMNVVHAKQLARRLADSAVTTYALHPGAVATNIYRALPPPVGWLIKRRLVSCEQGAETPLFCATAPELRSESGRYYDRCREAPASPLADDPALGAELWARSEAAVAG